MAGLNLKKRVRFKNSTTISWTSVAISARHATHNNLTDARNVCGALYILVISCRSAILSPVLHSSTDLSAGSPLFLRLTNLLHPKRSEDFAGPCESERLARERSSLCLARDAESHLEFMQYVRPRLQNRVDRPIGLQGVWGWFFVVLGKILSVGRIRERGRMGT